VYISKEHHRKLKAVSVIREEPMGKMVEDMIEDMDTESLEEIAIEL